MGFNELIQILSVSTAILATAISLISYWGTKKRSDEMYIPVFVINKRVQFQDQHYTFQIKNVKNNYVILKKVYADSQFLDVNYEGVNEIIDKTISGSEVTSTQTYEGHTLDVYIKTEDEFVTKIYIEGIDFKGNKFKVCTPEIRFRNYRILNTSLQNQYLEFIKK